MITASKIETAAGSMVACSVDECICQLEFSEDRIQDSDFSFLRKYFGSSVEEGENECLDNLRIQLLEYFSGTRKEFTIPLVTPGTPFQQSVWRELLNIKYGTTRSYIQQAKALGVPLSVRAVANANGKNRIAILIPCHRIIGSNGSLTGYAGGMEKKKWLIEHEQRFSGQAYDLSVF
jgi:AraC family transcriptional regulator of adaptative response/methylated-DNA-[protein]-cysteine methyltransferase